MTGPRHTRSYREGEYGFYSRYNEKLLEDFKQRSQHTIFVFLKGTLCVEGGREETS